MMVIRVILVLVMVRMEANFTIVSAGVSIL